MLYYRGDGIFVKLLMMKIELVTRILEELLLIDAKPQLRSEVLGSCPTNIGMRCLDYGHQIKAQRYLKNWAKIQNMFRPDLHIWECEW